MHKHKKVLTSALALLLCFLTVFSCAFADGYTQQQATPGYPKPPVFSTGGSGSSKTTYNSCIIVGYRFTCYRSTDYEEALKSGVSGKDLDAYLTKHDGQGKQLGHSINIILNAVNSKGDSRIDYANGYDQVGQSSPHMLITAEQDDLLNRIKTAQSEIASSEEFGDNKVTHSTKFDFMLTQFSGGKGGWKNGHYAGGYLYSDSTQCSTFTFKEPLYSQIENSVPLDSKDDRYLSNLLASAADDNPIKIYSGYYAKDEDLYYLNTNGANGEAKNMYTYIYGWQYSSQYGTNYDLKGFDKADILTISDVDYEDPTPNNLHDGNEVRPFNALPANVCNAGDPSSWVNRNASLVAKLCGLTPVYGEIAESEQEFGLYDYIIVEPIYSVYYWQIRYFLTCSDMALISAESMHEAKGNTKDCWYTVYHGGYTWFAISGLFPASYGTFIYTEESHFGVDGVFNATVEHGYDKNAFTAKNKFGLAYAIDQSSLSAACTKNDVDNDGQRENPTTHAFVFTNSEGYTMFTGGTDTHSTQERVWYSGRSSMFIAPYVAAQSLLGTGIWMSGDNGTPGVSHEYQIVYHANPKNGQDPAVDVTKTITVDIDSDIKIVDYIAGIDAKVFPNTKIQSGFWTIDNDKGFGIADNTIGNIKTVYDTSKSPSTQAHWKIAAGSTIPQQYAEEFFDTYGTRVTKKLTQVHVYAAWNTKMLVTTLNRTYDDASAQTVQSAQALGGNFINNSKVPTAISIIQTDNVKIEDLTSDKVKRIIPLVRAAGNDGYMWFPSQDSDKLMDSNSKYYIVYSFTEKSITTSNLSLANAYKILKNTKQFGGFMAYRNQKALVEWKYNTNLFYFDFYTYEVQATNCTITLTQTDYPGATGPNGVNTAVESTSNALTAIVARGASVNYTVVPSSDEFFFKLGNDIGNRTRWANTNQDKGHIVSDSAAITVSADTNTQITATTSQVSHIQDVVLGKELHKYNVTSGYKIVVTPKLDGVPKVPFSDYHVTILNTANNQSLHYKYKPTAEEKSEFNYLATSDSGVVTQSISAEGTFYILVSTTDKTGTESMYRVATVNTSNANSDGIIQVYVDYYTTEASVQSQSGGNHSNTNVTFIVSDKSSGAEITVVNPVNTAKSGAHECGTAYYSSTKVISLYGAQGYTSNLTSITATRTTAPDWYLASATSVTGNTSATEAIANDAYLSGSPTAESPSGLDYAWTRTVNSKYIVRYTVAPYHYITFVLDDASQHYGDMMVKCSDSKCGTTNATCACLPAGYSIAINNGGFYCLRGKYNVNLTDTTKNARGANYRIGNIIGTNKTHATAEGEYLKLTYNQDYSTNTVLRYYTLRTSGDAGYVSTDIKSLKNQSMGATAYVLQMMEHQHNYTPCAGTPTTVLSYDFNGATYTTTATLGSSYNYSDTVADGSFTVNNQYIGTSTNITCSVSGQNCSTTFNSIEQPSSLYWRSTMPKYKVSFVFRVNDVPYDTLPETVNNLVSLDGTEPFAFGSSSSGNVYANGQATVGEHTLYLGGKSTGVKYTVEARDNVYYIDFYTLRVAAGAGVREVSITPADTGDAWNGTLPYVRDGKTSSNTLAIWPASMSSSTERIYINARAEGEYQDYNDAGKLVWKTSNYTFNRWDTKRPTSNISIKYANNKSDTTTARDTYVVASSINHATVVQAEATTEGTTIIIPEIIEHNSIYYGVKLRTFLDGRITNPWSGIKGQLTLAANKTHNAPLYSGILTWSDCLDLVDKSGNAINDPYKEKSANATIAPSAEFESDMDVNTAYYYNASNAYIANKYAYIDAFYYTQTIQTQVNGVNTLPFTLNKYQEVAYRQYYNDIQVDTTKYVSVNGAGAYQTVMLKGMTVSVWGKKIASSTNKTSSTSIWHMQYQTVPIRGTQSYVIPYYTVTMKSVCDHTGKDITCPALTFRGSNAKNKTIVVMPGTYAITTSDTATTHSDKDSKHTFAGWELGTNEIFILEYVDSEGENPYPVLTYTGEIRASESTLENSISATTQVTVSDETNLIARYTAADELYALTLNSKFYDADGYEMQGVLQVIDVDTGLPVANATVTYYDSSDTAITITRPTASTQNLYKKTSDTGYALIPMGAVRANVLISKNNASNSIPVTINGKKTTVLTQAVSNGTFQLKVLMPIDMYRSDSSGNTYSTYSGQSAQYAKDSIVNVDGEWHNLPMHYPKAITVTFTMKCPVCQKTTAYDNGNFTCSSCKHTVPLLGAPQSNSKAIYYATANAYSEIQTYISIASAMDDANEAAAYLAQYGIVEMQHSATGTYTGTIPYSDKPYHLFIDGVRQSAEYDKWNTKTTQFVMAPDKHTCAWDGTNHLNSNNDQATSNCKVCALDSNKCGTKYSSFFVKMTKNKEYTAYAYQETSGKEPTNQAIEFTYVSIYHNTDYTNKLPYNQTAVVLNQNRYELNANAHACKNGATCYGTHIMVPNNAQLTIQAQRNAAGAYYTVFDGIFNATNTQSVLLSYNSITVKLAPGFEGGIDGTKATYAVYLANYAINNGKLTSTNTTYTVEHYGQTLPATTQYLQGINLTVHAPAGYTLTLRPQEYPAQNGAMVVGPFSGMAALQYVYVLPNTEANRALLSEEVTLELPEGSYIVGISTKSDIANGGRAMGKNVVIQQNTCAYFTPNTSYDIVVRKVSSNNDSTIYTTELIASASNTFTAGYSNNGYVFQNLPNGTYQLFVNGVAVATKSSDFQNVNGVTVDGTNIIVSQSKAFNIAAAAHAGWYNSETPGAAKTTFVQAGSLRTHLFDYAKVLCDLEVSDPETVTKYQNQHRHFLVGTDVWTQETSTQPPIPEANHGDFSINLATYRVETYVNNQLMTPFNNPVIFNGTVVSLTNGQSGLLFSVNAPAVAARTDVHAGVYDQVYQENSGRKDIVYDSTNRVFKVYYWTVTLGTLHDNAHLQCATCGAKCSQYHSNACQGLHNAYNTGAPCPNCGGALTADPLLGNIQHGEGCTEQLNTSIVVLHGTVIAKPESNMITIGNHTRIAVSNTPVGYKEPTFNGWNRYNATDYTVQTLESPVESSVHIDAGWNSVPGEYTVTLYNKSHLQTLKAFVGPKMALKQTSVWTTIATRMTGGTGNSHANAPDTLQKKYGYLARSTMTAEVQKPHIFSESSTSINVALTLTGYTSERAHTVKLVNLDNGTVYTKSVAANTFVANFTLPTGYYQLYVDDIKYSTPFSYNTHATSCQVVDSSNNLTTPYFDNTSNRGVLYVAPVYNVRSFYVSHWSETRQLKDGTYVEYSNVTCTDTTCTGHNSAHTGYTQALWTSSDSKLRPYYIKNTYLCDACGYTVTQPTSGITYSHLTECPNCGSEYFRMTSSKLQSPKIESDLVYNVYTGHTDTPHAPVNLALEVEMAYPVYVQTVVDGSDRLPFTGAQAQLQFSENGTSWTTLTENFDANGKATFYVPMGTQYRVVGASRDEWSTTTMIDTGWCVSKPYTDADVEYKVFNNVRYVWGDGDRDNDGTVDEVGLTYYVHYYTVTARTGAGTKNVTVSNGNKGKTSSDILDSTSAINTNRASISAVYQRGATATVQTVVRPGYLPVAIQVTKDNAVYKSLTVHLSTSSTSNDQAYKLTYNSTTQRYEHSAVAGISADSGVSRYYVWANGNNGTSEYTGVYVDITPYGNTVKWSGTCGCTKHSNPYNYQEECTSQCSSAVANHATFRVSADKPYAHSFTVYHTTLEVPEAERRTAVYTYQYASEHPVDPTNPNYDPDEPDDNDDIPQNTAYYYTLLVTGDAGVSKTEGSGTYLEGHTPNIGLSIQASRQNIGRTPVTYTLYLDGVLWPGQNVTIGGYTAKEISPGVYRTDYNFASGTYAVKITSPDTLLKGSTGSDNTIYDYVTITSTRTYTWKAWTDGHVICSECGATGACCDTDGTPKQCQPGTVTYCTNCHIILDSNSKEQSCCTTGDKKHTWTTCPYDSATYHDDCLANLTKAQTTQTNSVTMWHNTKLHGVTTHKDTFRGHTATLDFVTVRLYGDAGIKSVTTNTVQSETTHTPTESLTAHGSTAWTDSTLHRNLPERMWTDTRFEHTFFVEVVVMRGQELSFNADLKDSVKNHYEAKTALSIELTLDGKPYTGRTVTIGGYAATDADNDGIYVTSYSGFVGGKTYQVTVDGRNAGRIYLESYRSYRWLTWDELWIENGDLDAGYEDSHYCYYHDDNHPCYDCLDWLDSACLTEYGYYENYISAFCDIELTYVARTQLIDEFHVYVDANLNGGPDPYNPSTGDPDDPYKDPTDDDYPESDNDHWTPGNNPDDNPNPEYDPDYEPTPNPNYDPVNPSTPADPSKDPDNFDPNNKNDGFYEDAPIPFYSLTIKTRLNDSATDDFPVKFENLTSGVTIYIIPDGQTYHIYDKDGKRLSNVPYIVSMVDGTVKIALQDGDKYRVSVLDEIEDRNNNDVIDINDIKTTTLHSYTYTKHTESAISKAAASVTIDFYTLTLQVYSDGVQKLPDGKSVNGSSTQFESPVWLDDVNAYQDGAKNWWGETFSGGNDSRGDTGYYAVADANTVKVYLKGQPYDVNVKTADDDQTSRGQTVGTGYLTDYTNGTISAATTITVEYFSMTTDHHGGFTGTQINYGGKTHVSATTTAGATGNATAKAFFLKGTSIGIDATVATNNTWYQWTGTATYSTKAQTGITMNQKRAESAWAKTFYTVRYYLHDKHEGWYEVAEDRYVSTHSVVIDNRNWNSVTVTGEPNKYVNFDAFRTHSYSDPTSTSVSTLRDVLTNGVNTTTIDVVINANQVGGQSFVDFYYTRNGSKADPTPDTPVVPPVIQDPEEPVNPTPQKPEDWNPDTMQEYVTITYVMNGGKYNNSTANYSETHLAGTDITLITPTPPAGQEFVGWFLTDLNSTTQSASGLIGTAADHYLLCTDTVVYAVYIGKTDLGITANDIYGVIKTGSQFTSSATIVNHNKLSITPNNHINAVLTVKKGNTVVDTITVENVIVPGNGTQMISAVINTADNPNTPQNEKWDENATYTLTWSLDFSNSIYVDKDTTNNQSSLSSFKPNTYSSVANTARPGYSTDRPNTYDKDALSKLNLSTSNTAFYWEYWTWTENSGYNGKFTKQSGSDKMNIVIMLTPENESGLRTYTTGAFGMHNYTTRSGYGLSMHRVYNDLSGVYKNGAECMSNKAWAVNKSHITLNSNVGTLEALMTFPEFNYRSTYKQANGTTQEYVQLIANFASAGNYYSLTMPQYTDYETDDYNDQFAHYTPMWLPNGEYIPVTHISGVWTPIGELRATVQQGQYTSASDMHKYGVYTNEVVIKGSLFDDLYNNP